MKQEEISQLENELFELKARARNVGYKNIIPRLPSKIRNNNDKFVASLMVGFRKRLSNWKSGLITLENPGGLPSHSKNTEESSKNTVLSDTFSVSSDVQN